MFNYTGVIYLLTVCAAFLAIDIAYSILFYIWNADTEKFLYILLYTLAPNEVKKHMLGLNGFDILGPLLLQKASNLNYHK